MWDGLSSTVNVGRLGIVFHHHVFMPVAQESGSGSPFEGISSGSAAL